MSWEDLRAKYPWPAERANLPEDWHGWLASETVNCLRRYLGPQTRLVIECGSWLGMSARAILRDLAPHARLVCIDTWEGSPEHQVEAGNAEWYSRLPTLDEQFLANMWPWRDRLIPLRADSIDGLDEVGAAGLVPDLVYLDSEHTPARVIAELTACRRLFPRAVIVLDDTNNPDVGDPAREFAASRGLRTESTECATAVLP